jgi:hypothetical protein
MKFILKIEKNNQYHLIQENHKLDKICIATTDYKDNMLLNLPYKISVTNADELFGKVNLDSLAQQHYPFSEPSEEGSVIRKLAFKNGFRQATELNKDKLFTKKDIIDAVMFGVAYEDCGIKGINSYQELQEFAVKRCLEPTEIEVEIIAEPMNLDEIREQRKGFLNSNTNKPKLDENGYLILNKL